MTTELTVDPATAEEGGISGRSATDRTAAGAPNDDEQQRDSSIAAAPAPRAKIATDHETEVPASASAEANKQTDPNEPPFVIKIEYDPKKRHSLSISFSKEAEAASIDEKHTSTVLSNRALDNDIQSHILGYIESEFGISLPTEPKTNAERNEDGRIRREVSSLRRRLQSHPGESLREDDSDEDDDEEEDGDGPRPLFLKVASFDVRLADRDLDIDMSVSQEKYGDICASSFRTIFMDPILKMMTDANVENPFLAGGSILVEMEGLKVPGLIEFLAKEFHRMKVGGVDAAQQLSMEDLTSKEPSCRVSFFALPGTDLYDDEARDKGVFAIFIDNTNSWKSYNEHSAASALVGLVGGTSIGGVLNGLAQSDEDDYQTDRSFDSEGDDY